MFCKHLLVYISIQKCPFTKICPPCLNSHRSGVPGYHSVTRCIWIFNIFNGMNGKYTSNKITFCKFQGVESKVLFCHQHLNSMKFTVKGWLQHVVMKNLRALVAKDKATCVNICMKHVFKSAFVASWRNFVACISWLVLSLSTYQSWQRYLNDTLILP